MGTYWMFLKNAFRQNFIYRANTFISIITSMIRLLMQLSIWKALYANYTTVENISLSQMFTYSILTSLISALNADYISWELGDKIRSGEIGGDFVRPINLKLKLIAEQLGNSIYFLVSELLPTVIVAILFGKFSTPASVFQGVMFFISLILGTTLMYLINYAAGLLNFWLYKATYMSFIMDTFITLFAGSAIPLWFYPDFLQKIAMVLPFRYAVFEPINIYLGQTTGVECFYSMLIQLVWIGAIYALGNFMWAKAEKRVIVQGG